jgi:hypothetical protein
VLIVIFNDILPQGLAFFLEVEVFL